MVNKSFIYHPIIVFVDFKHDYIRVEHELPYALGERIHHRLVDWDSWDEEGQNMLQDEKFYEGRRKDSPREECELSDWMKHSKPTCNLLHELDFMYFEKLVAEGAYRHVWKNYDYNSKTNYALKTIKLEHHFSERNLNRHERDAIVLEQLTFSSHIPDIYGYCGHSLQTEFSNQGHIGALISKSADHQLSSREKLMLAINVAEGLSDLHFIDRSNKASVVHSDVKFDQFLILDGKIKLNDFNRCRFISRKKNGDECGFTVENNPGKLRSPEEYLYQEETEKIDVYSMGNVLFSILTGIKEPFNYIESEEAQDKIMKGNRPIIKERNSTDHAVQAIISAIDMCWTQDPMHRQTSKEILNFLQDSFQNLELYG